jgi:hypothetical protein
MISLLMAARRRGTTDAHGFTQIRENEVEVLDGGASTYAVCHRDHRDH